MACQDIMWKKYPESDFPTRGVQSLHCRALIGAGETTNELLPWPACTMFSAHSELSAVCSVQCGLHYLHLVAKQPILWLLLGGAHSDGAVLKISFLVSLCVARTCKNLVSYKKFICRISGNPKILIGEQNRKCIFCLNFVLWSFQITRGALEVEHYFFDFFLSEMIMLIRLSNHPKILLSVSVGVMLTTTFASARIPMRSSPQFWMKNCSIFLFISFIKDRSECEVSSNCSQDQDFIQWHPWLSDIKWDVKWIKDDEDE